MKHKHSTSAFPTLSALTLLTGITAAATVAGLTALRTQERVPPIDALKQPTPNPGGGWPFVSVIVPARNEERNLPRLLPTLLNQRYPNYEVIVVDDNSTDATPNILKEWAAQSEHLRVVTGAPLPADWRGKPWAMCQGASHARGQWLLFTDADTTHSPLSLPSTLAYAIRHGVDLMSILPHYELKTPAERIIMPTAFMGITNLYPPYKVNNPNSKIAIANGQYLLIRRDTYDAVGGIERVKHTVVEDLEFARVVKGAGHRLYLADGRHLMSVRMYTNLQEIWEGWSKNVVLSFQGKPGLIAVLIAAFLSVTLLPPALVRWSNSSWRRAYKSGRVIDGLTALWATALASWHLVLPFAYRRAVDRAMGLPPAWTLTQPLGMAAMFGIMLHSLLRLLTGKGVTWKGRRYHGGE